MSLSRQPIPLRIMFHIYLFVVLRCGLQNLHILFSWYRISTCTAPNLNLFQWKFVNNYRCHVRQDASEPMLNGAHDEGPADEDKEGEGVAERPRSRSRSQQRNSVEFLQAFLDQKNMERNPSFVILTIFANGDNIYSSMTLRDLLKLVQDEIAHSCKDSYSCPDDTIAVGSMKYRDIRRMESILSAHEEPAILVHTDLVSCIKSPK